MTKDLSRAKELLKSGGYTCVFVYGDTVITDTARGVAPLIALLDSDCDISPFCAADKVVGKAAAFLYLLLGIKHLYAETVSEPAADLLKSRGVDLEFGTLTPAIKNRTGDGPCPMESATLNITDKHEALTAIRKTLAELRSK